MKCPDELIAFIEAGDARIDRVLKEYRELFEKEDAAWPVMLHVVRARAMLVTGRCEEAEEEIVKAATVVTYVLKKYGIPIDEAGLPNPVSKRAFRWTSPWYLDGLDRTRYGMLDDQQVQARLHKVAVGYLWSVTVGGDWTQYPVPTIPATLSGRSLRKAEASRAVTAAIDTLRDPAFDLEQRRFIQ